MTPTQLLTALLNNDVDDATLLFMTIDAEPAWFPKGQQAAEPPEEGEPGEAQAIVRIGGKSYCVSVEELP